MNPLLQSLAEKFPLSPNTHNTWNSLMKQGIDPGFLASWLEEAATVEDLELLTEVISRLLQNGKKAADLKRWIDHSPYSVRDWAEAALVFFKRKGDSVPAEQTAHAFGYLTCCAETGSYLPNLESFREIVEQMLNFYGYDGRATDHGSSSNGTHC
ncbi:MAG: hypothetical protein ABQ298_11630 [Puniceicoccaceae bacterium]